MSRDRQYLMHLLHNELERQDKLWGQQDHPDGTGPILGVHGEPFEKMARDLKLFNDFLEQRNEPMWAPILLEEVYEALAEEDAPRLEEELLQVAAVAVQWAEALQRRGRVREN